MDAELEVEMGRGYVPGTHDSLVERDKPHGTIAVDALFSPIQKVKYIVTNARVKQATDYDKLTLEIWTDGSVHPEDALAYAAKIIKEGLRGRECKVGSRLDDKVLDKNDYRQR